MDLTQTVVIYPEQEPFTVTDTSTINGPTSYPRYKVYLPISILFVLLLAVGILAGVGYNRQNTEHYPLTKDVQISSSKLIDSLNPQVSSCVLETPKTHLNQLPDDIVHLCQPQEIHDPGSRHNMIECGVGSSKYIHSFCQCDKNITCKETQFDYYAKQKCTDCMKKYCPCQNKGRCNPCKKEIDLISCTCLPGTTGYYCTKISKRLCSETKKNDSMAEYTTCENSNNKSCITTIFSRALFCSWTDKIQNYPNCSSEIVLKMGLQDNPNSEGIRDYQKTDGTSTSRTLFLVILVVIFFSMFPLGFLFYRSWKGWRKGT